MPSGTVAGHGGGGGDLTPLPMHPLGYHSMPSRTKPHSDGTGAAGYSALSGRTTSAPSSVLGSAVLGPWARGPTATPTPSAVRNGAAPGGAARTAGPPSFAKCHRIPEAMEWGGAPGTPRRAAWVRTKLGRAPQPLARGAVRKAIGRAVTLATDNKGSGLRADRGGGGGQCHQCTAAAPDKTAHTHVMRCRRMPTACVGCSGKGGGGGYPLQGAQPMPTVSLTASASFNGITLTDSNRPQPLWQPPPTARLTASGGGTRTACTAHRTPRAPRAFFSS